VAVWTGKDMLSFGGSGGVRAYSDGAAYDPATNTWRKLAPIPASLGGNLTGSGSYAVWTGKVMVAWGFFERSGQQALTPATYNPATNSWTTGAAAPAQAPLFGDAFWTGKQMIVWGSVSPGRLQGIAYDPATGKWSMLPASPLGHAGRDSMLAVWTGRYLVVGGGDNQAGLHKDAAAYDPVTNSWMRLPDAPVGFEGNGTAPDIWTGASVITIEDGVPGGRPLSLDLTTRSWSLGPKAPVPGRQEAHEFWTGSKVLVWGGGVSVGNSCCKTVKPGYSYTP
jgi:N-acetylneuraminic acid mutarotase